MPKKSPQDTNARRIAIIELIAANPLPVEEIVEQLIPKAGRRTVYEDLEWILDTFPEHLKRESAGQAHATASTGSPTVGSATARTSWRSPSPGSPRKS